ARALEPLRQRAQAAQPLDRGRRLYRDVADDVVLEHATAGNVARLRLALSPSGDLDEHRKLFWLADARAQALPGVLRLEPIGFGRGQDLHFLEYPVGPAALGQIGRKRQVDVA